MKPHLSLLVPLALVVTVAGCATNAPTEAAVERGSTQPDARTTNTLALAANGAASRVVHNITIETPFSSPGAHSSGGGVDPPTCAPGPADCKVGGHEAIEFPDTRHFDGTMVDTVWSSDSMERRAIAGTWSFTGTIAGCTGSGTVTIPWTYLPDAYPIPIAANPNGEILHTSYHLTTPTNFTGFANIEDVFLVQDSYANPVGISAHGTLTGYILCE